MGPATPREWDLFCRVIDNHGDIGVSLRLGRDLAQRGESVRLWCDDLSALAWMQPDPVPGLSCRPWTQADTAAPGDVVIETFGCELPPAFVSAMAARSTAPVWINLEYLSAEDYVERSHGLRSPQMSGPGKGLDKWFFYPGFNERTGGLLREPALLDAAQAHEPHRWLATRGWAPAPGERVLSLFAYPHAPWAEFLDALDRQGDRWLLLMCPGAAQQAVPPLLREGQRALALPYLSQADYDRLLWSCDLNLVRGEDSFVRAQWAGRPMLWQIYFQDDGAHSAKLEAFLATELALEPPALRESWSALSRAWNGLAPWSEEAEQALHRWPELTAHAERWRAGLGAQSDLVSELKAFVSREAGVSG
ncbi:elongation factor P maturation arginine rhamnosyltransferase EarP [Roseateles amylovorans]|uniref:Protein-arginine rhamnosyltransferase n=1 Tax=Roseateles amylovorans TaxID=2978473 RepID=A0ABY6B811_9BURK|nr:elongation factor P maturation arginine rhamnosyltransferase EarP [Roseateles amylovorans]UXH80908.1 elongation factor P maturation arginine rhamnosyltransferase EarP [Roseateles amylovorans]